MKGLVFASLMCSALLLAPATARAQKPPWTVDVSIFGLLAGMSGEVTVGVNTADVNLSFEDVLENLDFGAMGSIRVGRGRWALTTEVIYMALGADKDNVSVDEDQFMLEPSLSYRLSPKFEALGGVRYNNLKTEIRGPFGRSPSGTVDWWDPFVGGRLTLPVGTKWTFNFRGDVGGFGVGSEFAWQAFPYLSWTLSHRTSLQGGYRWISVDYEQGSGASEFQYDVVSQGPQFGLTLRF